MAKRTTGKKSVRKSSRKTARKVSGKTGSRKTAKKTTRKVTRSKKRVTRKKTGRMTRARKTASKSTTKRKATKKKVAKKRAARRSSKGVIVCKVHRDDHCEKYDERKIYASIYSSCHVAHMHVPTCERFADKVTKIISKWVSTKKEVNSDEIFKKVYVELKKHSKDAAYLYKHHKDVQ